VASPAASLGAGLLFGLAMVAPPGPMNAVIADESVTRGWLAGATAGLGARVADACFFVFTLVGVVGVVDDAPTLRAAMLAGGGLLMLYFAYDAVATPAGAAADGGIDASEAPGAGPRADGFLKAFVLALTNPYQILFWLTVGVGMLRPGSVDPLAVLPVVGESLAGLVVVQTGGPVLVAGFFAGIALWVVGFPATLVTVGRRVESFDAAVATASAVVLVLFGLWFLADAASTLAG
jgi:threonine/homoserine/homoserine lactone efflux protein